MKRHLIFAFTALLLLSAACTSKYRKMMMDELNSTETYLTQSFLEGEWRIDSIVGDSELIEEWAYFTNEGKFWRFSYHEHSYLIDKELPYKFNFVYREGKRIAYRITEIDTNNIILTDSTHKKFHLTRWMPFSQELIEGYLIGDSLKKRISGVWKLDSAQQTPITFPTSLYKNFCYDLSPGSKLLFSDNGEAIVFNGATHTPCKQYFYKVFRGYIAMEEFETVYDYEILELTEQKLTLQEGFGDQNIFYFSWESE